MAYASHFPCAVANFLDYTIIPRNRDASSSLLMRGAGVEPALVLVRSEVVYPVDRRARSSGSGTCTRIVQLMRLSWHYFQSIPRRANKITGLRLFVK